MELRKFKITITGLDLKHLKIQVLSHKEMDPQRDKKAKVNDLHSLGQEIQV